MLDLATGSVLSFMASSFLFPSNKAAYSTHDLVITLQVLLLVGGKTGLQMLTVISMLCCG